MHEEEDKVTAEWGPAGKVEGDQGGDPEVVGMGSVLGASHSPQASPVGQTSRRLKDEGKHEGSGGVTVMPGCSLPHLNSLSEDPGNIRIY